MLLDQQYPMEHAFRGPWKILERFGTLAPGAIAAAEPDAFADLCSTPPAIHRYGRSMAGRVQQLAVVVRDEYDGRAESIWQDATDADDLLGRLRALPGFGDQKARIFAALVGKQLDVRPAGWQEAVGPYAEDGSYRSVADVVDAESLAKVREFKQAAKAEAKAEGQGRSQGQDRTGQGQQGLTMAEEGRDGQDDRSGARGSGLCHLRDDGARPGARHDHLDPRHRERARHLDLRPVQP